MSSVTVLSADAIARIDREIAKYPVERKSSAVMSALAIAQREKGWISKDVVEFVASYLDMAPIAVWEVATFYGMYNLEQQGRFKIAICTNLPCALQGAEEAAEHLKKKLKMDFNQTSVDGRFTLKEGECMGACGDAPVCIVNDTKMMSYMTPAKLDELLDELKSR
ncbi:MAG: NADH-quinone oxidoreductase subunit NuoE [Rubricoccaceae bacterium]|nr:NADH-quinone oxidoreductase subunit NuoE [Rubricoccaceae bacterium]